MPSPSIRPLLCLIAAVATATVAAQEPSRSPDQWAHWRGPTGNGVAINANPPLRWGERENVRWKVAIPGLGSGTPAVWDDRLFVVTAVPTRPGARPNERTELEFRLLCFDRDSGDLRWQRTATTATPHEGTHSTNGFASASPCTDGRHVYAHFGSRGLYCYTLDGEPVWKRDDFGRMSTRSEFGEGSSPTLFGDKILVPWDHEGPSALFALDKSTGQTVWKTSRDEPTCWATPLVVGDEGRWQVVMNGQNAARAYDLETGEELWRCGGQTTRPVASPVAADGLVFVGSGFRGSFLAAFRPDGRGDIEGTSSVVWTVHRDTPDIASPLLSGGRLYFYKGKSGLLTCLDAATGKPHYTARRVPGINSTYASPVAAGGHVFLTDRNGTTVVIRDSDRFEVVATNSVGETVDATPVAVGDRWFIRGEKHLFCLGPPAAE